MIRRATLSDMPALLQLGERMHAESAFARHAFDTETATDTITSYISLPHRALWVALRGDVVVGGLLAFIAPFYFSRALYAGELALYVGAEHRGGSAAFRLVRELLAWAREKAVAEVRVGVTAGINNPVGVKLYTGMGFRPSGDIFVHDLSEAA